MRAEQVRNMAEYNQWMNERIYSVCAELSDIQLRQDRGVFFKSIHGTLNHLLLADNIWLGRFLGEHFIVDGLDQELYHDFEELRRSREEVDEKIKYWAEELSDETLAGSLRYMSIFNPAPKACDMWLAVTHFFNHQTHHRGQLTAMLSQCGKDYGVTDIIWLPRLHQRNGT